MKISHWLKTADVIPDVKRISIEYIPKTQTTIVTFVTTTRNQFQVLSLILTLVLDCSTVIQTVEAVDRRRKTYARIGV